jgi:hypothetical protein
MFVLDEEFQGLDADAQDVVAVLHSINEPKIAAADHPAEPTQSFVVTSAVGGDLLIRIILYLTKSRIRIPYVWDEGAFPADRRGDVEAEALDFVENMGFMMDNLNLEKLKPDQRRNALSELPLIGPVGEPAPAEPAEPPSEEAQEDEDLIATTVQQRAARAVPPPQPPVRATEPMKAEVDELDALLEEEPAAVPTAMEGAVSAAPAKAAVPELAGFDLQEEDFQRSDLEADDELSSIAALLDGEGAESSPEVSIQFNREEGGADPSSDRVRAWIRLMATF